jgi:hypothetical protein
MINWQGGILDIRDCLNRGFTGKGSYADGDELTIERCIVRGNPEQLRVRVILGIENGEHLVIDADANRSGDDLCFRTDSVCYEGSQYQGKLTIVIEAIDSGDGVLDGLDLSGTWWDQYTDEHHPFNAYVDLIKR